MNWRLIKFYVNKTFCPNFWSSLYKLDSLSLMYQMVNYHFALRSSSFMLMFVVKWIVHWVVWIMQSLSHPYPNGCLTTAVNCDFAATLFLLRCSAACIEDQLAFWNSERFSPQGHLLPGLDGLYWSLDTQFRHGKYSSSLRFWTGLLDAQPHDRNGQPTHDKWFMPSTIFPEKKMPLQGDGSGCFST